MISAKLLALARTTKGESAFRFNIFSSSVNTKQVFDVLSSFVVVSLERAEDTIRRAVASPVPYGYCPTKTYPQVHRLHETLVRNLAYELLMLQRVNE